MKSLAIPADFAHRDEVKLLALEMVRCFQCSPEVAQFVACQVVFLLWLDWARSGKAHRPFSGRQEQVDRLVVLAVAGPFIPSMLGSISSTPTEPFSIVLLLCVAGVLALQDGEGGEGYTLAGFGEYNAHLHPDWKCMQSRGGIIKKRNALLRQAANDGAKQRTLIAQAGFVFPSDEPATEQEQNEAIGYILQLHMAMDLPVPRTGDWSSTLVRDAIHIVRHWPAARLLTIAEWIMEHRAELAGQDPEWFIRNFKDFAAKVPEAKA